MSAATGPVDADRRTAIADTGIALVARHGIRALNHRALDRELGLPIGSTSYYLRTRRALVEALVRRLADRTSADIAAVSVPAPAGSEATVDDVAGLMADLVGRLIADRSDDQIARYALTTELAGESELHALLTDRSPIRLALLHSATGMLEQLGVHRPSARAPDLVAVADGLVYDRVVGSRSRTPESPQERRASLTDVFRGYLRGVLADRQ